jgi:acyl-CoA reductase-like NAD-dependent aldehyde dehydrogenase
VTISPYQTYEDALATVSDSRYGLQAGVFTNDINRAFAAHRALEVGRRHHQRRLGVPGGSDAVWRRKDSGFGREGLKYAMDEMTEPRIMVLSHVPL